MNIGTFLLVFALANKSILCHLVVVALLLGSMVFLAKSSAWMAVKPYVLPLVFLCMSLLVMVLSFQIDKIDYLFFAKSFHMRSNYASVEVTEKTLFQPMAEISATYSMVLTIPMDRMTYLLKSPRTPKAFIEQMALMYRFIATFFEEFHALERALILKGGYRNRSLMIRSSSIITGALFDSTMKSFTSYKVALDCKLFNGRFYL